MLQILSNPLVSISLSFKKTTFPIKVFYFLKASSSIGLSKREPFAGAPCFSYPFAFITILFGLVKADPPLFSMSHLLYSLKCFSIPLSSGSQIIVRVYDFSLYSINSTSFLSLKFSSELSSWLLYLQLSESEKSLSIYPASSIISPNKSLIMRSPYFPFLTFLLLIFGYFLLIDVF